MAGERQYAAVEVVGRAAGINQAGWEGAIADNECTMLWNMSTNSDGEWTKRKGQKLLANTTPARAVPETLKLHWHTDEDDNQADGTTWVETGDEVTAASAGALTFLPDETSLTATASVTLDGEAVKYLTASGFREETASVSMASTFNYDAEAGRLKFFARIWNTTPRLTVVSTATSPPEINVYLFYASSSFNIFINTEGSLIWKYGAAVTEYLNAGPLDTQTWYEVDIRWDNSVAGLKHSERFRIDLNGETVAKVDPAAAVTMSFDTNVYWFNTGSAGVSAPHGDNWLNLGSLMHTDIALISSWSYSGASDIIASNITGIHNNSSQQRAILTLAGGSVTYSPGYTTAATGTYTVAAVRTSATECQGNIYIVDGTANMRYIIGSATAVTTYALPETAKWIEEYHGHLCIAGLGTNGAHSVRLSTIDDFTTSSAVSWPATNQVFKCRDTVRGIKAFDGQLIVGTRSTIEAISGYLSHDFAKTIVANAGCASHWSMQEIPLMDGTTSALIWAGYDGIYLLMQGQVTKMSWNIQTFWNTLSKVEIEESHAVDCRDRGEYMLAVSDGTSSENTHIIVYNYRKDSWAIWKYAVRMDVLGKYYRNGKEIILGGDSSGRIFELNRGDNDNGSSINGYLLTKWHDGGMPDQEKDFRRLYVWAAPLENHNIEIGWSTDYKEGITEPSIVAGTDGNDYTCISSHEPSVVVGTDSNDYYCADAHTSAAGTCPITGGSYATVWTATGTTGRGVTWATSTDYVANDDKKPITGGQYALYWVVKNTVGEGSTWSASAGYAAENVQMEKMDSVILEGNVPVFGTAVFGVDKFGAGVSTKIFGIDLSAARGRAVRFLFRNQNADEPFKIRGYKAWFTYIPEFPA